MRILSNSSSMNFKVTFQLLALLSSPSRIIGSPLVSLFPRTDPCSPGGTPILYQNYSTVQCPPAYVLLADGSCPVNFNGLGTSCISYCEVWQYFTYDEEKPVVNNPYCYGPLTCTVTTSKAFTYTYNVGISISVGLSQALTAGITGGLSYASATTQLQSTSVNLAEGQCGYFTFLPILHTSW